MKMLFKNYEKFNFIAVCLIILTAIVGISDGCSRKNVPVMPPKQSMEISAPTNPPTNSEQDNKNMNQSKLTAVSPGNWGATGISLMVEENAVKMEFDCAVGEIKEKLIKNADGEFDANGFYTAEGFGPVVKDNLPKPQPAHYVGKISGDTMTLNITLTETKQKIGNFSLERGKFGRLRKCY